MDEHQTRRLEWLKYLAAHTDLLASATQAFEHAALRALFITNGGAAVAMLAFVGTDAAKRLNVGLALIALALWGFGLFFAGWASWLMYFSQLEFYKASSKRLDATVERHEGNEAGASALETDHKSLAKKARANRRHGHWLGATSLIAFLFGGFFAIVSFVDVLKNQ